MPYEVTHEYVACKPEKGREMANHGFPDNWSCKNLTEALSS